MPRVPVAVFLFFLGLYGATFHGYVDIEDVEVCFLATQNLVEHGSLALGDSETARRIQEEDFVVVEGRGGRYYPIYPLLQVLIHLPFYLVGKALGGLADERPQDVVRLAFSAVDVPVGALLCAVVFLLGKRLGHGTRAAAAGAFLAGCCTMLWPYAQGTFPDLSLALLVACSCLALLERGRREREWLVVAGIFQGLAIALRPQTLLLVVPSLIYVRRSGGRTVSYLAPIVAVLAGLLVLDHLVLGRPLGASYAGYVLDRPPLLTHSYSLSLLGLTFSDGKGLFTLSPILLVTLLAAPALYRRSPNEAGLVFGHLAVLVLFFAAFDGWGGGWCWGPRLLLPAVPLVAAVLPVWLERPEIWRRLLTVALVAVSLWIQVLAVAVPHRIYLTMAAEQGGDLSQFYFYTRFSPVLAHQRLLVHKLHGGADVYTLGFLFDEPDERPIDVTRIPDNDISHFNRGFDHLAWVRVVRKGHAAWALAAVLCCLVLMATGLVWTWRATNRGRELDVGSRVE